MLYRYLFVVRVHDPNNNTFAFSSYNFVHHVVASRHVPLVERSAAAAVEAWGGLQQLFLLRLHRPRHPVDEGPHYIGPLPPPRPRSHPNRPWPAAAPRSNAVRPPQRVRRACSRPAAQLGVSGLPRVTRSAAREGGDSLVGRTLALAVVERRRMKGVTQEVASMKPAAYSADTLVWWKKCEPHDQVDAAAAHAASAKSSDASLTAGKVCASRR